MKLTNEELRRIRLAGNVARVGLAVVYLGAFFLLCIVGLAIYIQANGG